MCVTSSTNKFKKKKNACKRPKANRACSLSLPLSRGFVCWRFKSMSARRRRNTENEESENDNSDDGSIDEDNSSVENIEQVQNAEKNSRNLTPDNTSNDHDQSLDRSLQRSIERKELKDPANVPRSGRFFLHDDRDDPIKPVHNRQKNNSAR
jgi:hypothetical protein